MDSCISHVIGSADKAARNSITEPRSRGSSPAALGRKPYRSSRSLPDAQGPQVQSPQPTLVQTAVQARSNSTQQVANSVPGTPDLLDSPLPYR